MDKREREADIVDCQINFSRKVDDQENDYYYY